jgi:hypothetical protein
MFLVEWCYGECGSPIRDKVCDTKEALKDWVDTILANGAAFVAISIIGVC